jgi:Uncharacterised nucleotidyltransferase
MRPPAERRPDPLVALTRAFLDGEPWVGGLTESDWDRTVTRAEDERLAPMLHRALPGGAARASILGRLRRAWLASERQHVFADAQLRELVGAFAGAGIRTILLKGPALAREYYADPALRPFTDLDVLVERRDRTRAIDVLSALGYAHGSPGRSLAYELEHAPATYFVSLPAGGRLPVDLHWELVAHPGGSRATELVTEEIWSRALSAAVWGPTARTLAPEDLVIYLAAHFAIHHVLVGPLWQLDLALVLRRHAATLDWDAVVARAQQWSAASAVYFALRTVGEQLGVTAPPSAFAALRPGRVRVAVVRALQRSGSDRLVRVEYLVGLLLLDRCRDVIRTLTSGLMPPPSWLRARYGSRPLIGAYATHYCRLVRIAVRAMRARGSSGRQRAEARTH